MKKNITINLYGSLYAIDEDASKLLEEYLQNMHRYFGKREGGDEIADDIERRVAELFCEIKAQGVEAISIEHVQKIIHRIGNPEEMDDEETNDTAEADGNVAEESGGTPPPSQNAAQEKGEGFYRRRLYRDPQDQMLGGVMSGLCRFFGSTNPLPWRILMVLLFILSCTSAGIFYLVAWALLPPAVTAEDRLKMMGIPINPQTLNEELMKGVNQTDGYAANGKAQTQAKGCFASLLGAFVFLVKLCLLLLVGIITVALLVLASFLVAESFSDNFSILCMVGLAEPEVLKNYPAVITHITTATVAGLVTCGIVLYALIRSLICRPSDARMSIGTKSVLTVMAVLSLAIALTFTIISSQTTEKIDEEIYRNRYTVNGIFIGNSDKEKLKRNGWHVVKYSNANKYHDDMPYNLVEHCKTLTSDKQDDLYLRFSQFNEEIPMNIHFERSGYYPAGFYYLEAMAYAKGAGNFVYAQKDSVTLAFCEIPSDDLNGHGNMVGWTRETFNATTLLNEKVSADVWEEHTRERIQGWSYVRSASFHHPGGPITTGFTNLPQVVGAAGNNLSCNFGVRHLSIVPDSTRNPQP